MAPLELYRRQAIRRRMSADGVVEHLDVIEDVATRFLPCCVGLLANALTFEQLEEALRHCIVVAVASPAHTGLEVVIRQKALPLMTCELATLIGMHNDRITGSSAPDRHVQGIKSYLGVNAAANGPANDLPGVQIDHHSQVQPPFVRGDIRDVGDPGDISLTDFELLLQQVGSNHAGAPPRGRGRLP